MSFGSQFLPTERRLCPNIYKLHHDLLEKEIRSGIAPPDEVLQSYSQKLGRLYNTAPDHPIILARVQKKQPLERNRLQSKSTLTDDNIGNNNVNVKNIQGKEKFPTLTSTLITSNQLRGGKYDVSGVDDSYCDPIIATVSQSSYNVCTPKTWPEETTYPSNSILHHQNKQRDGSLRSTSSLISDRPCRNSQVYTTSSSMSALQRTLHECGRLQFGNEFIGTKVSNDIGKATKNYQRKLRNHLKWLESPSADTTVDIKCKSREKSTPTDSSISSNSCLSISDSVFEQQPKSSALQLFSNSKEVATLDNSSNIFRKRRVHDTKKIKHCRTLPRIMNADDPMDYKEEMRIQNLSRFNACIQPAIGIKQVPSQKEVTSVLLQLTRKQIMCYQTRIIESAELVKALKDTQHGTPGFQAILTLHEDFIMAASANINPVLLSKVQIYAIIQRHVPWLDSKSIGRLLTSYDTTNTGIMRFVRISTTLLCCFEPAMIKLASSLDKNSKQWSNYYISNDSMELGRSPHSFGGYEGCSRKATQQSHTIGDNEILTEVEWKDFRGEIFVIRFLHKMYSDCNGCTQSMIGKDPVMKLEDLKELFTCCVTSTDEESMMEKLLEPMLQYLLLKLSGESLTDSIDRTQNITSDSLLAGSLKAEKVLKYARLKSLFSQLVLDIDSLVDAVLVYPNVLREFIRQMRHFRKAASQLIIGRKSV